MEVKSPQRTTPIPSYEPGHFEPPAPVARVTLRGSDRSDGVMNVPMLLDTGADADFHHLDP